MKKFLVVPGDGIGREVMAEALTLINVLAERTDISIQYDKADWGAERYLREKVGIPKDIVIKDLPRQYDAILFGALGDPRIPDMAHGREILLGLRFGLDLYINLRPVQLFDPSLTPLKSPKTIDMVIFRENTEDIYQGHGGVLDLGLATETTVDESRHSFRGVSRIVEAAFSFAKKEKRKRVTLIDKSNAISFGGSLWQRTFFSIAKDYPNIAADHLYVDIAALKMVTEPERFDVIVTSNLFGDILSDLGAGIIGGLGLAASANINPGEFALFEPVHGSAPDIAGKNQANPFAMFLCVAQMMRYFNWSSVAQMIESSVVKAIKEKKTTKDLGGNLSCSEAATFVINTVGRG